MTPNEPLKSGEIISETVQIPKVKLNPERFNTQNLQEELQKSMQQIVMEATEKETVDDSMDNIKKLVEDIPYLQIPKDEEVIRQQTAEMPHIETDAEIDDCLKTNFREFLAEDRDGQMSLYVPEHGHMESQITGQLCIDEVLAEWEKTKRAAEAGAFGGGAAQTGIRQGTGASGGGRYYGTSCGRDPEAGFRAYAERSSG